MKENQKKRMNKNTILFAVILLCLAALIYLSLGGQGMPHPSGLPLDAGARPAAERAAAPDFTLADLEGKKLTLSELRGKVVVLNFWTTTCGPCVAEMPSLDRLYATFSEQPFKVVAVTLDAGRRAERTVNRLELNFPVVFDHSGRVADRYQVRGTPTSFIIDKQGMVVERANGPVAWDEPAVARYLMDLIHE